MIDCDSALLYLAARDERLLTEPEAAALSAHTNSCRDCAALTEVETQRDSDREEPQASATAETVRHADGDTVTDHSLAAKPRAAEGYLPAEGSLPTVDPDIYEWGACIGQGGMGRITRVRNRRLARDVAIKEAMGEQRRLRFEREALITARLQHPAIVPVYEAGTWPNGAPFYAMKMVVGTSLQQVIEQSATLDQRIALVPKVIHVAEALAYAHAQRIVHRDLKPANVLVGEFGETVVIDWGLAKELSAPDEDEHDGSPYRGDASLTVAGEAFGTPRYMPPEQARGASVDERADVYALGAILYHLMAGAPPYSDSAAHGREVLTLALHESPTHILALQPECPADLVAVIDKAMAREPGDRYANAGELAKDLERFQAGQLVSARDYSSRALARRWLAKHRTGVVIAASIALVGSAAGALAVSKIVDERNRARDAANEAKGHAHRATHFSGQQQRLLTEARIEQGRVELLAGRPAHAAMFFREASQNGGKQTKDGHSLTLMMGRALRTFQAREAILHTKERIVGAFFVARGRAIVAVQRSDDLALLDVSTRRVVVLLRDVGRVSKLATSPDGTRVVCFSDEQTSLWATADGQRIAVLGRAIRAPRNVWFGPKNRHLAVAERDGTITIRDMRGAVKHALGTHKRGVIDLSFHHSGDGVAIIDDDHTAWVFGTTGRLEHRYRGTHNRQRPTQITIGHDKKHLLLNSDDFGSFVELSGKKSQYHFHRESDITSRAVSPDGKLVALGYASGKIELWNMAEDYLAWVTQMPGHAGPVSSLQFSSDNQRLVSGGTDWTARLWDAGSGALAATYVDQPGGGDWRPLLDADGKRLLVVSGTRTAIVWRAESSALVASLPSNAEDARTRPLERPGLESVLRRPRIARIRKAASAAGLLERNIIGPGHEFMLTATTGGADVSLWRIRDGSRVADLPAHTRLLADASFRGDGKQVATVDGDGTIRVYTTATGTQNTSFKGRKLTTSIALSPDGARIVTGDMAGTARLWNARSGALVASLPGHAGTADVSRGAFSPDSSLVVTTATDGRVRVWLASNGALHQKLDAHDSRVTRAFFHDDDVLVTTAKDTAKLWRKANAGFAPSATIQDRKRPIGQIAVNADASLIATFGPKLITVWDATRAAPVARLNGAAAAFSRDGELLATATNRTLLVWQLRAPLPATATATNDAHARNPYELRAGRTHVKRRASPAPVFVVPGVIVVPNPPPPTR